VNTLSKNGEAALGVEGCCLLGSALFFSYSLVGQEREEARPTTYLI
jgi:hypothetical protein